MCLAHLISLLDISDPHYLYEVITLFSGMLASENTFTTINYFKSTVTVRRHLFDYVSFLKCFKLLNLRGFRLLFVLILLILSFTSKQH